MIALITKRNKPRVTIVAGIVRKIKIGFRNTFKIPKTVATINAVVKSTTVIPGKK